MSWLSNVVRGKHPMTRGADGPMTRPPASGPTGSTPGQTFPIGSHSSGGNIQNSGGVNPTGVNNQVSTPSGGADGDKSWSDYLLEWGGDAVKAAAAWAKAHGGQALDLGLGGLSAYNSAKLGAKSEEYATNAHDQAQANWKSREPLRLAGVNGMLNAQPSAFGSQAIDNLGTVSSRNPFAKPALRMAPTPVSAVPGTPAPGVRGGIADFMNGSQPQRGGIADFMQGGLPQRGGIADFMNGGQPPTEEQAPPQPLRMAPAAPARPGRPMPTATARPGVR